MPAEAWITTSWDDGNPLDMRIAELLHRNNLPGTFYIPRAAPTGVMPESQIRELSQSFEIGGHTLDHLFLPSIPDDQAASQIEGCKRWVQDTTGQTCAMFCPPAGKYEIRHVNMIGHAGFIGFRSVELLSTDPGCQLDGLVELPTTLQAFGHQPITYLKNTIKRHKWSNLWRYILLGTFSNWDCLAEKLLAGVVAHGGVFHLWGHSWEIDRHELWEPLERVLRIMGQMPVSVRRVANSGLCDSGRAKLLPSRASCS